MAEEDSSSPAQLESSGVDLAQPHCSQEATIDEGLEIK